MTSLLSIKKLVTQLLEIARYDQIPKISNFEDNSLDDFRDKE